MTDHTYAGHTLAEIKEAANSTNDIIRSHGWDGTVEMGDHMGKDEAFMKLASPATVPAMAAQIEEMEREAADLRTTMIAAAEEIHEHWKAHCDAEGYGPANLMTRLERGVNAGYPGYNAGQFTRAEQRITELERERDYARLEGWLAAREQAAKVCADQKQIRGSMSERFIAGKCEEHIRAMQPPAEWKSNEEEAK